MNLKTIDRLIIQRPGQVELTRIELQNPEQVFSTASHLLPRIAGAKYRVKASESGLAATRGLLSPSISLDGVYYTRYSALGVNPMDPLGEYSYTNQMNDNSYKRVSLSMQIPIFGQLQTRNQINQAKILAMDSKLALELEQNTLRQEINQAFTDAENAWSKYIASSEALLSVQEAFNFTRERFQSGLATTLEFNISKNQLSRIESELLQAKYEYLLRSKILDFYQGIPISL